jgi:hypothetical protein
MEPKPVNSTPPQTVYKTPDPQANVSELYTIYAQQIPAITKTSAIRPKDAVRISPTEWLNELQ